MPCSPWPRPWSTIALKLAAVRITGSVGLLSDAGESLVNLATALLALFALWYAAHPPDRDHTYGHSKIEYFASGIEGVLILLAGGGILVAGRLSSPPPPCPADGARHRPGALARCGGH